jgi:GxxExxY protein
LTGLRGKDAHLSNFAFKEVSMQEIIHKELSGVVLKAAFAVHGVLGSGLLEAVYEGAYVVELEFAGVRVERQVVYPVEYRGEYVGAYIADILVENTIIVELKSVSRINEVMEAQLINYLRLSKLPVGYLLNFHNTSLEWRRFVNTKPAAS